jgi:hypothetical protein
MKKIHTTIFSVAIMLMVNACGDFLEQDLKGTYSTASFYKTESHANLALTGIYNVASFASTDNALWVFGDVASDDAVKGGGPGDQNDIELIGTFDYNASNGYLEKVWKHYYEGITRANYLLYYGNNIAMDATRKARVLGEAKFLRAYFYFNLVNIYGEIPLKTQPPLSVDLINVSKSSVQKIYEQIEADLLDAKAVLPVSTAPERGRATRGAAWGLLAKARIYQEKWNEALVAIDSLENLGIYALEPLYKNNFLDSTQNNAESVFEIQHLAGQDPKLGSHLNQWFSPPSSGGYYFDTPVQSFIDAFEVTGDGIVDPRLDYTVGREGQPWVNGEPFDPTWSPTGYLQKKHVQSLVDQPIIGDAGLNYVYLRYADILLMKAEALNELGRSNDALTPLNAVRKRARESYLYDDQLPNAGVIPENLLPDVTTTYQSLLRDAIRHERRVELGFEFHRYFDLMRYGKTVAEAALSSTFFNYDTDRYFMIPQNEVDRNKAL